MRTNDVPNLPTGKIWVGDGNTIVSDTVFLDEPNGRMGIGTTSPSQKLEVNGSGLFNGNLTVDTASEGSVYISPVTKSVEIRAVSTALGFDPAFRIRQDGSAKVDFGWDDEGTSEAFVWNYSNGGFKIGTNNSERFRITSTGNVGIGTTSPTSKLTISSGVGGDGSWNDSGILIENTSTTTGEPTLAFRNAGTSGTGSGYWFTGLNQSNLYKIAFGTSFTDGNTKLELSTTGGLRLNSYTQGFLQTDANGNVSTSGGGVLPGGPYLPLTAGSGSPLTGDLYITKNSPVLTITDTVASDLKLEIKQSGSTSNFMSRGGTSSKGQFNFRITDGSTITNALFINQQANVGIGTTSPSEKLHIYSGAASLKIDSTTNESSLKYENSTTTANIKLANNDLKTELGGSERMRITSTGNVGIGTTSPNARLDVIGRAEIDAYAAQAAGNNAFDSGYLRLIGGAKTGWGIDDELGKIEFYGEDTSGVGARNAASIRAVCETGNGTSTTTFSSGLAFYTSSYNAAEGERLRINNDGNVGIGTTSPTAKLEVTGSVGSFKTTGHQIFLTRNGNNEIYAVGASSVLALGQDNAEKMRIHSNGNVGIGTTSPSAKLDVNGTGMFRGNLDVYKSNAKLTITSTGSTEQASIDIQNNSLYARWILDADDLFRVYNQTSGYSAFAIKSNGNVGIGTTISVREAGSGVYFTRNSGDNGTTGPVLAFANDSTKSIIAAAGDGIIFKTRTVGGAAFSGSETMRITSGGNVGIGTTAPGSKLEIRGNDPLLELNTASSTGNPYMMWSQAGVRRSYIQHVNSGDDLAIASEYGGMRFSTGVNGTEVERMRITSGGNVGIGTNSPANILDVVGISRFTHSSSTSYRGAIETVVDNAFPTWDIGWLHARTSSSTYGNIARFNDQNGSQIGGIFYSGSSGTSFVTTSDYRLKENIEEISDSISRVKKLKPCRFNFTAEKNRVVDGFIAHEVQKVVPEAVHGEKDALQENGSIDAQTLEVSRLIPVLTKALQEAIAKIEQLETRIQILENK
jgi:hypothetical protein